MELCESVRKTKFFEFEYFFQFSFVEMFQFLFNSESSERLFFQQSSRVEFYLSVDFNWIFLIFF